MFLPLFFNSWQLSCLVVGGGKVAGHKLDLLLAAGCVPTVVAPEVTDKIRAEVERGRVTWHARTFKPGDCKGFRLVIAATPLASVNREVSNEAQSLGIPVNVVDAPELCTVIFGANWREGPLTVSVSTGGQAPFMASAVRDLVAETAAGMGQWVAAATRFRATVRRAVASPVERDRLFHAFASRARLGPPEGLPQSDLLADWLQWLEMPGPTE